MQCRSRIIGSIFFLLLFLVPGISYSGTFEVCGNDLNTLYSKMDQGYVVTRTTEVSSSTCITKTMYRLESPSNGKYVCSHVYNGSNVAPSDNRVTTLPNGWYVTKTQAGDSRCMYLDKRQPLFTISNNPSDKSWICSIRDKTPNNFVIISDSEYYNTGTMAYCHNLFRTTYKIAKISSSDNTTVCRKNSTTVFPGVLPNNYIVYQISDNSTTSCSNGYYSIRKPETSGYDYACVGDNYASIPNGYSVITEYENNSQCDGNTKVKIQKGFQNGGIVCSLSGLPSNKVVTNIYKNYIYCSSKGYKISNVSNGLSICSYNSKEYDVVPQGYVVTSVANDSSQCGTFGKRYTIKTTANTSYFCADSISEAYNAIPSGYGITSFNRHSFCYYSGKNAVNFKAYAAGNEYCRQTTFNLNQTYPDRIPSLPSNLVVTRTRDDSVCEKIDVNKPNTGTTNVCAANFPSGYIWVEGKGKGNYSNCKSKNGYTITKAVNNNYWLCYGGSTLPATLLTGYAISGTKDTSRCLSAPYNTAFKMTKVQGDGPHSVCDLMGVPSGYIVTKVITNSSCQMIVGNGQGLQIQRPSSLSGNIVQCISYNSLSVNQSAYYEQIPAGYVPIAIGSYNQCNATQGRTGYGFTIAKPETRSSTIICQIPGYTLPVGYVPDGASFSKSSCGSYYSGIKIKPDVIIPLDFVEIPDDVTPDSPPKITFPCATNSNNTLISGASSNQAQCQNNMPVH